MNDLSQFTRLGERAIENLTTAVTLLDSALTLVYLNPAAEMLFEISARKARGMPLVSLLLDQGTVAESMIESLESGHPFSERELTLSLPGGRSATVDCIVSPVFEPNEPPVLLVEWLHLDRHLRISREEHLINQHNATSALLRGLAHEIKNPLGGLRGAAQLLERELESPELREYTAVIIDEADRLQNLVDRMLGPRQLPQRAEVNVHQVLERVRQLVRAEAPPGVSIRHDYDPSIPHIIGDHDQLVQAALNIVRNAVQALGDKGQVTLRTRVQRQFTINHRRHKLVVRVDIIDNGPGIPPDLQESIFYPMVSGHAEGTGLGLSIAQSVISQHGGLIECRSKPGRTVFSLLLPLEANP